MKSKIIFPRVSCSRLFEALFVLKVLLAGCVFAAPTTAVLANGEPAPGSVKGKTSLVSVEANGQLRYSPYTAQGDTLMDYSMGGYRGGIVPIPLAVVRETLFPDEKGRADDSERIQAALDKVSQLPLEPSGLRGAVLLKKGTYRCANPLKISASGVVLRGEGNGENGTILFVTYREQNPLIKIGGEAPKKAIRKRYEITDDYVPVGARSFSVAETSGLTVGQTVYVFRRGNQEWINFIGMNRIPSRIEKGVETTKQWRPFDLAFDRVITAIRGKKVTVDAPIACAIERGWGGGAVQTYSDEGRIQYCGVESMRAISEFDKSKTASQKEANGKMETVFVDEDHATYFVSFESVKNAWASKLTTLNFYNGPAVVRNQGKWITVEDCLGVDPVSVITGGRRYPYFVAGQLVLVQRCYSERARHAFAFDAHVSGPNVFYDCRSEHDYASSEPHHLWSVGGLYDNVEANMAIQDRGSMGSGHGWSGANYVVWNSKGKLICQKPPTAQNFAIGFKGDKGRPAYERPNGWWESDGTPVVPQSLYQAQLKARLSVLKEKSADVKVNMNSNPGVLPSMAISVRAN